METLNNTQTTIELTPAELELIRIKREEEALAQQKKSLERKASEEKQIVEIKKKMENDLIKAKQLREALLVQLEELNTLNPGYELQDVQSNKSYELYHYSVNSEKEFFFQETQQLPSPRIVHIDSKSTITAHEYFVDKSSSKYHSRMESQGIRFKLDISSTWDRKNDHLKSAKTINEKIQTVITTAKRKTEQAQSKATGIQWLLETITSQYPTAISSIAKTDGYFSGGRFSNRGSSYVEGAEYVKAVFANKLELHFGYSTLEGVLQAKRSKIVLGYMSAEDQDALVNQFAI